jgi:hypothetical protein
MATDFLTFNEGTDHVLSSGMPATCHFLLSTDNVAALSATSTLAGGVGEITGTGYGRTSQSLPTPTAGDLSFTPSTWTTGSATDWPASVCSIILATTSDNSGVAIAAWNLVPGGAGRDLSHASTTEVVTPTLTTESVDMSFANTAAMLTIVSSPTFTTAATAHIIPTDTVTVDVGSNCVATGGGDFIYKAPSTGVYQVAILFAFFATANAAGFTSMELSPSVGSVITGTADLSDAMIDDVSFASSGTEIFSRTWIGYLDVTAGQYINATLQFSSGVCTQVIPDAGIGGTQISIQRIA